MPKPTKVTKPPEAPKGLTREKVIFIICLVLVVVLGFLLWRNVRRPAGWTPTPSVGKAPTKAEPARRWTHAAPPPPEEERGDFPPEVEPAPPPPPVPRGLENVPLVLVDGGWVVDRPSHPRNWTDFQVTRPSYFVSDEEQRRFREYWMKEANVRVSIYCDFTSVCPPDDVVDKLLTSLFDDAYASGPETPEQSRERRGRWRQTLWDWRAEFGTPPQSVFSLGGLEQFRGPDVPKPPLRPDSPDAGAR